MTAKVAFVSDSLSARATGGPVTVKTLDSIIDGMFSDGLTEEVRSGIIKGLESSAFIAVDGTRVSYPPAEK